MNDRFSRQRFIRHRGKGYAAMRRLLVLSAELTVAAMAFTQVASGGQTLTNRYVVKDNPNSAPPYDSLYNAASNIQIAIDYSYAGETVLVSAATYDAGGVTNWPAGTVLTNRVAIWKPITVMSANNDPTNTIIKGAWDPVTTNGPAAVRCVYMASNSTLIGFMLTNGATLGFPWPVTNANHDGGGLYCSNAIATVSNCVITCNSAARNGGGAYKGIFYGCTLVRNACGYSGGGVYNGALYNCTLIGNIAAGDPTGWGGGGGASGGTLYNCTLTGNKVTGGALGCGAGTYSATLSNCTLIGNTQTGGYGGGGACGGALYNCTVVSNSTTISGGGAMAANMYNCLIVGNYASTRGGGAYQMWDVVLYNCTIVGNSANGDAGGGVYNGPLFNCIVYSNKNNGAANYNSACTLTNCCTTPTNSIWVPGDGNITNDPRFVDYGIGYGTNHVGGDYHLKARSPCIDAGTNGSWTANSFDRDGRRRVVNGRVDIGCYEYPSNKGTVMVVR